MDGVTGTLTDTDGERAWVPMSVPVVALALELVLELKLVLVLELMPT
jgi:hypothetical protein